MTSTHQQPNPATAYTPRVAAAGHQTQVQALARYAARATFGDLSAQSRTELPVHILDCLACSSRPSEQARSAHAATRSATSAVVTG